MGRLQYKHIIVAEIPYYRTLHFIVFLDVLLLVLSYNDESFAQLQAMGKESLILMLQFIQQQCLLCTPMYHIHL